jgi:hypothetical protein
LFLFTGKVLFLLFLIINLFIYIYIKYNNIK